MMMQVTYSKWKSRFSMQRPTTGSKPWFGNFCLGIMVDSHPRFFHIIIGLVFVELVLSFTRDVTVEPGIEEGAE